MTQDSGNTGSFALKPVPLTGGLDLTTPRMLVEPGRLVDVLNYECVDTDGYKKIDGFERYDGGPGIAAVGSYAFYTNAVNDNPALLAADGVFVGATCGLFHDISVGAPVTPIKITAVEFYEPVPAEQAYWRVSFDATNTSGIDALIDAWDNTYVLFVYDSPTSPTAFVNVTYAVPNIGGATTFKGLVSGGSLSTSVANTDANRAFVTALPQDQFPYANQFYKDRLHVVANCRYVYLAYDLSSPAVGEREFFVGNVFRVGSAGGLEGRILDWRFLRGGFDGLGTTNADRAWIKVLIYPTVPDGTATDGSSFYIDRVNDTYTTTIGGVDCWNYQDTIDADGPADTVGVWGGVLYKSIEDGTARTDDNPWTQIDMGYEVFFEDGDSVIEPKELTLATTQEELDAELQEEVVSPTPGTSISFKNIAYGYEDDAVGRTTGAGWDSGGTDDQIGLTSPGYDLSLDDDTGVVATQILGNWGDGTGINFQNFGLLLPEDIIITGIKLEAKCWWASASASSNPSFVDVRLMNVGETDFSQNKGGAAFAVTSNAAATPTTLTFGGPNDLWGLSQVTAQDLNTETFGVVMTPSVTSLTARLYMFWDTLKVTVYYFRPTGKLFFRDSTDSVESKLVRIHLDSGSWADGTAKGVAHVYDFIGSGARNVPKVGDALRLTATGDNIGTVTAIRGSFLPSHSELVGSDRRFQTSVANYFLNPDWETIYGVHGLGRAWSYDNNYFRKIYTAYDTSLDKPAHLAVFRNYLCLGYPSGNMLVSAISGDRGPLPEEFRPLKGAREFSFSSSVHGFAVQADTSLAVFCKASIERLVLNPNAASADALFYTATISATSGCIEYTVASFGDSTLYCDQYGVRTIEQTDVYGDLIARPLSFPVSPWLRPRLSDKKYWTSSRVAQRPLFAHAIKAKNQYRVWFDDGYVLCMNLNTREAQPQFTLLRYGFNFGGAFAPLLPVSFCSATDEQGSERLFVTHWDRKADSTSDYNLPSLFKYPLELERGWSFDGQDFPCRMTVNLTLLESPYNYDSIRKAELHGLDYNNTTLFCGWGTRYSEEQSYSGLAMGDTFTPAGRNATSAVVSNDYIPFSKMIQVATRGRPLMMKLKNSTAATGDESASAIEPPHILQAVLLQYIPLRNEG